MRNRGQDERRRGPIERWPILLVLGGLVLLAALACRQGPSADRLPPGDLIVARSAGLSAWLEPLSRLPDSPLARAAGDAESRLDGCDEVEGQCAAGDCSLMEQIACRTQGGDLEVAWGELGDWDWLLSHRRDDSRWLVRGRRGADGGLEAEIDLFSQDETGPVTLLLPAEAGPGPAILGGDDLLVHMRFRPDSGLDVASWIAADDMGAKLFQLKSDLFLAAILAGNWELAVHVPMDGARFPPMALALDVRSLAPAVAAMERLLEDVTVAWPVRRDPYELDGWQGECLSNLNVLPELAPCYVATDQALVMGWNALSLELALAGPAADLDPRSSAAAIHFDRFPLADDRLGRAYGSGDPAQAAYPWGRASVTGTKVDGRFRFSLRLTDRVDRSVAEDPSDMDPTATAAPRSSP